MSNTSSGSNIRDCEQFIPANYPNAVQELFTLKQCTSHISIYFKVEIIVSYLKKHSLKIEWIDANPALARMVTSGFFKTTHLELLFNSYKLNNSFISDFEDYISCYLLTETA